MHDGTLFYLRPGRRRAGTDSEDLLDRELDVGPPALVGEDLDVFQTHQGLDDLTRVVKDEGASCFLAHTSSLKHLRRVWGTLSGRTPLKSEEPHKVSLGETKRQARGPRSLSLVIGGVLLLMLSRADDPSFVGEDYGLDSIAKGELRQDTGDVGLYRRTGDDQCLGDLCHW